jgi:uncharacterized membrane protein YjfL (UPF0719 family)
MSWDKYKISILYNSRVYLFNKFVLEVAKAINIYSYLSLLFKNKYKWINKYKEIRIIKSYNEHRHCKLN